MQPIKFPTTEWHLMRPLLLLHIAVYKTARCSLIKGNVWSLLLLHAKLAWMSRIKVWHCHYEEYLDYQVTATSHCIFRSGRVFCAGHQTDHQFLFLLYKLFLSAIYKSSNIKRTSTLSFGSYKEINTESKHTLSILLYMQDLLFTRHNASFGWFKTTCHTLY